MSNIYVSQKHGVNPSVAVCVACGTDHGVILFGRLRNDAEAPRVVSNGFCLDCESVVKRGGVMLVGVRDGEEQSDNPYRTGHVWGITGEAFERIFTGVEKAPMVYIEESVARKVGLPPPPAKKGGVA